MTHTRRALKRGPCPHRLYIRDYLSGILPALPGRGRRLGPLDGSSRNSLLAPSAFPPWEGGVTGCQNGLIFKPTFLPLPRVCVQGDGAIPTVLATLVPENDVSKDALLPKADHPAGAATTADVVPSTKKSESPAKPEVKPQVRLRMRLRNHVAREYCHVWYSPS